MKTLAYWFLGWGMLAGALMSAAEPGRPVIRAFPSRELGGGQICWSVIEDARGMMYVGADKVLEFDGEVWRPHDIPGRYAIRAMDATPGGPLWIGAINEVGYFDRSASGELGRYHSLVSKLPEGTMLGDVWHVFGHESGAVFVTSDSVLQWDGQKFKIDRRPGARRLAATRWAGRIFVEHPYEGMWTVEKEGLKPFLSAEQVNRTGVSWIEETPDGWVLATGRGMEKLSAGRLVPFAPEASAFIAKNILTCATRLANGDICVGTLGGLVVINPAGEVQRILTERNGLISRGVYSMAAARDGSVWITSGLGVTRILLDGSVALFDKREGLTGNPSHSLVQAGSRLLVSTDEGVFGLPLVADAAVRFEPLAELPSRYVDLVATPEGVLAAGYGGAYHAVNGQVNEVYPGKIDILFACASTKLPGAYYLADGFNLVRFTPKGGGPAQVEMIARLGDIAKAVAEDDAGQLWIGTAARGVYRVRRDGSGPLEWFPAPGKAQTGSGMVARVGNAIAVFLNRHTEIFSATDASQLPAPATPPTNVFAVSNPDDHNRVWVAFASPFKTGSRTHILGRLSCDSDQPVWETFAVEGLADINGILQLYVDHQGDVWCGGTNGALRFTPRHLRSIAHPRAPLIQTSIQDGANIDYRQNGVAFDFATAEYGRRETLRFQTRLTADDEWSEPVDNNHLTLAGLRDGKYAFGVRVINDVGLTSPSTTVTFTVLPPWYRSKLAYAVWTLCALVAVCGVIQWRSSYLRRKNLQLEALVLKKTEQLEKAHAAKSEFLANMSHEIRNPISGILGLSLAMDETNLNERQRQLTQSIHSCATLLTTLVDDVLDFSKIEAGKIELHPAPFPIRAALQQCAAMVAEDVRKAGGTLDVQVGANVPARVTGDSARIQQILLNYLSNAVKFSGGKPITLGAELGDADLVRFTVSDQGPGMTDQEAATLFTKFSRLELARAGNIRGSGLGLAVCRLLATKMGGAVGVISRPGEGSCFWAELPLARADDEAPAGSLYEPSGPPLHALVVEDIAYNATAMQAVLRKLGITSEVASDGHTALEKLQHGTYDVAFMDWNLPGIIGTEVVARYRAIEPPNRRTIIIATTAYSGEANRDACLKAGMDAFIAKPFTPEKISAALGDLQGPLRAAASVAVHPPAVEAAPPEVDLELLKFLGDNTPEGLTSEIDRYLTSFDGDRALARQIIGSGNATEIHRIAHRLCSHASIVKYEPLARLAGELQARAATDQPEQLAALFAEYEQEFRLFRSKLESIRVSKAPA